jgi:hypothetical protein
VLVAGCETSSTVTAGPNPVKCQVSLGAMPTVDAVGGGGSLAVTTQPECAWDASVDVSWITGLSPASGQGTANVAFQVAANEGASAREAMIVVNGEPARVSQRAPCRYDVAPSSQNVGAEARAGVITITTASECAWTAAPDVSWITVTSGATGSGNGSVAYTVAPNEGGVRNGAIVIANQRSSITQGALPPPPPPCNPTISSTSQSVAAAGGAGTVTVSAAGSCPWTAGSNAPWIAISSGANGAGNGSVTFNVAANTGAERTGTLTIAGRVFTVSQAAGSSPTPPPPSPPPPPPPPACNYSISPNSANASVLGGTGSVAVSAGGGCAWTAQSNASWMSITSGVSGSGNGSVGYLVIPNISGSRTGSLTIAGQTFTVTQAAVVPCTYSISPGSQQVGRQAGSGSVQVSAGNGCTWTAASNSSWITVTSGASGSGNGTVTFSFPRNNGNDRTGSLTVATRTATVQQRGNNGGDDDDDD